MIHKIQTSEGNHVALEVKDQKWELCLCISKGGSLLIFNQQQTHQLNAIVQSIDAANYALKEYGSFKKWPEIFNSTANPRNTTWLDARIIHTAWESVVANKVKQSQFSKAEVYKVSISAFRGIKSFQIREWLVSSTYSGFGKQGISLPSYKIKELQMHLTSILQEFMEE